MYNLTFFEAIDDTHGLITLDGTALPYRVCLSDISRDLVSDLEDVTNHRQLKGKLAGLAKKCQKTPKIEDGAVCLWDAAKLGRRQGLNHQVAHLVQPASRQCFHAAANGVETITVTVADMTQLRTQGLSWRAIAALPLYKGAAYSAMARAYKLGKSYEIRGGKVKPTTVAILRTSIGREFYLGLATDPRLLKIARGYGCTVNGQQWQDALDQLRDKLLRMTTHQVAQGMGYIFTAAQRTLRRELGIVRKTCASQVEYTEADRWD